MRSVPTTFRQMIPATLAVLPQSILKRIEESSALAQGKGMGAGSVHHEAAAALSLLRPPQRQGPVVLDIGANRGSWTSALLSHAPSATVYAFEPSAITYSDLVQAHGDDHRVKSFRLAVSDEVGTAQLWSDVPGSGLSSLTQRRLDHFDSSFLVSEEVAVTSIDAWHEKYTVNPTVLKIDVEGHELAVLRGARSTLRSVHVVQFEFGGCNIDTRTFFQDFYYFFLEAGFLLYRLGPRGLIPISGYRQHDEVFMVTNYFAQRRLDTE